MFPKCQEPLTLSAHPRLQKIVGGRRHGISARPVPSIAGVHHLCTFFDDQANASPEKSTELGWAKLAWEQSATCLSNEKNEKSKIKKALLRIWCEHFARATPKANERNMWKYQPVLRKLESSTIDPEKSSALISSPPRHLAESNNFPEPVLPACLHGKSAGPDQDRVSFVSHLCTDSSVCFPFSNVNLLNCHSWPCTSLCFNFFQH